jgi:sugar phosphate isomerase/epimerase
MTTVLDVAMKLSIPIVAVRSEGKMEDRESTKQVLAYLKKLCELAENQGVSIAVKPHVGHSFHNTKTLLQLLNEINSPALGINLDSSNFYRAGDDPAEAVLKLGSKIVHAHIRDCSLDRSQGRTPLETQIAGRGILDWPCIIENLKKVGYKKALDTQIIGAFTRTLSCQMGIAAEARGYLNRCLQQ